MGLDSVSGAMTETGGTRPLSQNPYARLGGFQLTTIGAQGSMGAGAC